MPMFKRRKHDMDAKPTFNPAMTYLILFGHPPVHWHIEPTSTTASTDHRENDKPGDAEDEVPARENFLAIERCPSVSCEAFITNCACGYIYPQTILQSYRKHLESERGRAKRSISASPSSKSTVPRHPSPGLGSEDSPVSVWPKRKESCGSCSSTCSRCHPSSSKAQQKKTEHVYLGVTRKLCPGHAKKFDVARHEADEYDRTEKAKRILEHLYKNPHDLPKIIHSAAYPFYLKYQVATQEAHGQNRPPPDITQFVRDHLDSYTKHRYSSVASADASSATQRSSPLPEGEAETDASPVGGQPGSEADVPRFSISSAADVPNPIEVVHSELPSHAEDTSMPAPMATLDLYRPFPSPRFETTCVDIGPLEHWISQDDLLPDPFSAPSIHSNIDTLSVPLSGNNEDDHISSLVSYTTEPLNFDSYHYPSSICSNISPILDLDRMETFDDESPWFDSWSGDRQRAHPDQHLGIATERRSSGACDGTFFDFPLFPPPFTAFGQSQQDSDPSNTTRGRANSREKYSHLHRPFPHATGTIPPLEASTPESFWLPLPFSAESGYRSLVCIFVLMTLRKSVEYEISSGIQQVAGSFLSKRPEWQVSVYKGLSQLGGQSAGQLPIDLTPNDVEKRVVTLIASLVKEPVDTPPLFSFRCTPSSIQALAKPILKEPSVDHPDLDKGRRRYRKLELHFGQYSILRDGRLLDPEKVHWRLLHETICWVVCEINEGQGHPARIRELLAAQIELFLELRNTRSISLIPANGGSDIGSSALLQEYVKLYVGAFAIVLLSLEHACLVRYRRKEWDAFGERRERYRGGLQVVAGITRACSELLRNLVAEPFTPYATKEASSTKARPGDSIRSKLRSEGEVRRHLRITDLILGELGRVLLVFSEYGIGSKDLERIERGIVQEADHQAIDHWKPTFGDAWGEERIINAARDTNKASEPDLAGITSLDSKGDRFDSFFQAPAGRLSCSPLALDCWATEISWQYGMSDPADGMFGQSYNFVQGRVGNELMVPWLSIPLPGASTRIKGSPWHHQASAHDKLSLNIPTVGDTFQNSFEWSSPSARDQSSRQQSEPDKNERLSPGGGKRRRLT
ncbi:hypothetical protein IAU59_006783 [Kwoniella sp. CBS 9459]